MKKFKCSKVIVSLIMMIVVTISSVIVSPQTNVEGATAKALTTKDFVYSYKEKGKTFKVDVYAEIEKKLDENDSTWYYYCFALDDSNGKNSTTKDFKTYRGIKLNDSYNKVVKKYGKAKKIKYNKKSQFGRWIGCDDFIYVKDLSYYIRYNLKNTKYSINFFFDKSNKLIDVYYFYNVGKVGEYLDADEESKIDFFDVPTGEKITKTYYKGKTVYEIPKKSLTTGVTKDRYQGDAPYILFDKNGKVVAISEVTAGLYITSGKSVYDVLLEVKWYTKAFEKGKRVSKEKIKKYLDNPDSYAFISSTRVWNDNKPNEEYHPVSNYFRFKLK